MSSSLNFLGFLRPANHRRVRVQSKELESMKKTEGEKKTANFSILLSGFFQPLELFAG